VLDSTFFRNVSSTIFMKNVYQHFLQMFNVFQKKSTFLPPLARRPVAARRTGARRPAGGTHGRAHEGALQSAGGRWLSQRHAAEHMSAVSWPARARLHRLVGSLGSARLHRLAGSLGSLGSGLGRPRGSGSGRVSPARARLGPLRRSVGGGAWASWLAAAGAG
jgi:hypothetical protein